jgi:thiol-disulfide isomerase/thioredoxin
MMPAIRMVDASAGPAGVYSPKFLAFALENPKAPEATEALALALQTSGGVLGKAGTYKETLKAIGGTFATHPGIGDLARRLGRESEPEALAALRAILEKNTDPMVQALACRSLIRGLTSAATIGERINTMSVVRDSYLKLRGKAWTDAMVTGVDAAKAESAALAARFSERYAAILPELEIGNPLPELVSRDLDGKTVRLSDLKGRVVVLDVWATWCGPCVAMIPHEREMVERLKGKPFTLVSISADEELATLKKFLDKEPMPWNHWWNGSTGGIIDTLDIRYYPTIFVLDQKGVLRFKDVRGEALEKAVNGLLSTADAE